VVSGGDSVRLGWEAHEKLRGVHFSVQAQLRAHAPLEDRLCEIRSSRHAESDREGSGGKGNRKSQICSESRGVSDAADGDQARRSNNNAKGTRHAREKDAGNDRREPKGNALAGETGKSKESTLQGPSRKL
jgi:hypothetical protein